MDENYEKAKELCQKSKSWFFSADGILFKQAQLCLWYKKRYVQGKENASFIIYTQIRYV